MTDHTVSRRHAALELKNGCWQIVDLGSANGTYVNGERIDGINALKDGDQIKLGGTLMLFRGNGELEGVQEHWAEPDVIDLNGPEEAVDTSILSAVQSSQDNVVLTPPAAEARQACNLMYQLAEAIGAIRSTNAFLKDVTRIILEHIPVDRVFVLMPGESSGAWNPVSARYREGRKARRERITISRTIINHVIETQSGVLCTNAATDKRFSEAANAASLQSLALRSVICVPIMGHDQVLGVIHLDCPMSVYTYCHEELRLATAVGRVVGLAIENHHLAEARMKQERLAATGETVAYISHHVRNILQGLRSGADVVDLGVQRENLETIKTGWRIVENNLDRIYHLTSNMLTFSKDREPKIEMVQLNSVIEDAISLAQHQARERGVALHSTLDDMPAVPTDAEGVHQAVLNLILNAVAACPAGRGRVETRTRFHPDDNKVTVTVSDNGPGIPQDMIGQIFVSFHSSKGQGGTGLGLAATKKIVNELGGEIHVESALNAGTRFVIKLPAARAGAGDPEKTHGPAR